MARAALRRSVRIMWPGVWVMQRGDFEQTRAQMAIIKLSGESRHPAAAPPNHPVRSPASPRASAPSAAARPASLPRCRGQAGERQKPADVGASHALLLRKVVTDLACLFWILRRHRLRSSAPGRCRGPATRPEADVVAVEPSRRRGALQRRHRREQSSRVFVLRVAVDVLGAGLLHDAPFGHHQHLVADVLHHRQIVGNEEIGEP